MRNRTAVLLLAAPLCMPVVVPAAVIPVAGMIARHTLWESPNVYLVTADVTVDSSVTLTMQAGVVVKFQYQEGGSQKRCLTVNGSLDTQGTPDAPVVFTSERDDTCGGDSNGDGAATTPAAGDWGYVKITRFGSAISGCQFRYGGRRDIGAGARDYMLWITGSGAPVDVQDCMFRYALDVALHYEQGDYPIAPIISANTISDCPGGLVLSGRRLNRATLSGNTVTACGFAIECRDCSPRIEANSLTNNTGHPLKLTDGSTPRCVGNRIASNTLQSIAVCGILSGHSVWEDIQGLGLPYFVGEEVTVSAGGTLTIRPGVVVKFRHQDSAYRKCGLRVNGSLCARGLPRALIIFTSERDDAHGGDSNGDGAATRPSAGDWGTIKTMQVTDTVEYCAFLYGCYTDAGDYGVLRNTILWMQGGGEPVDVRSCTFR